jgi:2-polyprenyl-6-methoxyphenol hydroxylase-like FAD-dependent oxidoreductase
MRAQGIDALRRTLVSIVPWLADRVGALTSFDDVKLLDVQVNRLDRWFGDGILFLGDAAHAMSPVGGVGINLALADAVAAARILARPLRAVKPARGRAYAAGGGRGPGRQMMMSAWSCTLTLTRPPTKPEHRLP